VHTFLARRAEEFSGWTQANIRNEVAKNVKVAAQGHASEIVEEQASENGPENWAEGPTKGPEVIH
jgi:hypothetical protein